MNDIDPKPERRDPKPTTEQEKEEMRQKERRRLRKLKQSKRPPRYREALPSSGEDSQE